MEQNVSWIRSRENVARICFFYHQLIGRLLQIFGSFIPVVIATVEFHAGGADYP
jgi:hypothetical protein